MSETAETQEHDFQNQSFESEGKASGEVRQEAMEQREGQDSESRFDEVFDGFDDQEAGLDFGGDEGDEESDAEARLDDAQDDAETNDAEARFDDFDEPSRGDDAEARLEDAHDDGKAEDGRLDGSGQHGKTDDGQRDVSRPNLDSWELAGASGSWEKADEGSSDTHRVADQSERTEVERGQFSRTAGIER